MLKGDDVEKSSLCLLKKILLILLPDKNWCTFLHQARQRLEHQGGLWQNDLKKFRRPRNLEISSLSARQGNLVPLLCASERV